MRTPNSQCIVCGKELYRRPSELAKSRYSVCLEHREMIKKLIPPTQKQLDSLESGRRRKTNNATGRIRTQESKNLVREKMIEWSIKNSDIVKARGVALRGENHYKWSGGSAKIRISIRIMKKRAAKFNFGN